MITLQTSELAMPQRSKLSYGSKKSLPGAIQAAKRDACVVHIVPGLILSHLPDTETSQSLDTYI